MKAHRFAMEKKKIAKLTNLTISQVTRGCTILRKKGLVGFQRVHTKVFNSAFRNQLKDKPDFPKVKTYWGLS